MWANITYGLSQAEKDAQQLLNDPEVKKLIKQWLRTYEKPLATRLL